MKVFKYKFSKLTTGFIYAGLALCVAGLAINIYSLVTSDIMSAQNPVYPIIQHALFFLIPIILLVILISLLVSSYYSIDEKTLKTSFGIIKSKYDITEIETIILDRTTDKLSVFFKSGTVMVIVVNNEWYDDFIDALCKANSEIEFSIKSKEHDDKDDNEKDNKRK